jgi:anti-sigma B factor antagonist
VRYSLSINENNMELKLEGDIELSNIYEIKSELLAQFNENPLDLIIDLSKVTYIDSSGMSLLIETKRVIEGMGKTYWIQNIPDEIKQLFKTVALDQILTDNLENM